MTSRRTGVTNVSKTDNDDYHDNDSEKERKKEEDCKGRIRRKGQEVKGQKGMPDLRQTIMSEHLDTRNKLKGIASISSFYSLIDSATISQTDRQILVLHYIEEKTFSYIGDMLGYSESTIKKRHKKILKKLAKLI